MIRSNGVAPVSRVLCEALRSLSPPQHPRLAWRATGTTALLAAFGMSLELLGGLPLPGLPTAAAMTSIVLSLTIAAFIHWRRYKPDARLASLLFIANSAGVAAALALREPHYAVLSFWAPFQIDKLACIAVAVLAPELWSGVVAITLHLATVLLVLGGLPDAARAQFVVEPLATFAFATIGVVLVYARQQRAHLEEELAKAHAESEASARLARTIVALRDLANTPIQTIDLCNALLRDGSGDHALLHARIDRAVDRLREMSRLMHRFVEHTPWDERDAGMDPLRNLEAHADAERQRTLRAK